MNRKVFTPNDAAFTTNYLGYVYRTLIADGYLPEKLLKGTGLVEDNLFDPDFRCTFKQHKILCLNTMSETGDPHLGPRTGAAFNPINLGLPASAAMSSESFGVSLDILQKYLSINFPIVSFDLFTEKGEIVLQWQTTIHVGEVEYFVLGAAIMVFENLFRVMLKEESVSEYAEFSIPPPPGADAYCETLKFPVYFNSAFTRLVVPGRFLNRLIEDADPLIHRRALRLCEKQRAESFYLEGLDAQIGSLIVRRNYHSVPIEQASSELGMSERNLRRQLNAAGTSYKKIVNHLRESRARELLAVQGLPITEIAYELGFSDPSNFARTFKRWTGLSPHKYRETLATRHK